MLISKRRLIHAISYEVILLVIIAIALSFIFSMPLEVTGVLGVIMAVISVIWNMIFNHYFEKIEFKYQWERTIPVRIMHGIGFEGGLMLATIPIIAYMMNMSFIEARGIQVFNGGHPSSCPVGLRGSRWKSSTCGLSGCRIFRKKMRNPKE